MKVFFFEESGFLMKVVLDASGFSWKCVLMKFFFF